MLNLVDKARLVELFFANGESLRLTRRKFFTESSNSGKPIVLSDRQVSRVIAKWRRDLSVVPNRSRQGRPKAKTTQFEVDRVKQRLADSPRRSTRRISRETGISQSSVWRIIRKVITITSRSAFTELKSAIKNKIY